MIPSFISSRVDRLLVEQLRPDETRPAFDFASPPGANALTPSGSVSWKVFGNPLSLTIGGITAVLLELAEPRIRSGVWDHTTFRTAPLLRMRRTALAAMITVYGAEGPARRMISGVRKMHDRVTGITSSGIPYRANDPELLRWVHATAAFGFLEAYHRYVQPLSDTDRDRYYAEGKIAAGLYGAANPPENEAALRELFHTTLPLLEPSEIIAEFISILHRLPLTPRPFRIANRLLVAASIDLLPRDIRHILHLKAPSPQILRPLRLIGSQLEKLHLPSSPRFQAIRRLAAAPDSSQ